MEPDPSKRVSELVKRCVWGQGKKGGGTPQKNQQQEVSVEQDVAILIHMRTRARAHLHNNAQTHSHDGDIEVEAHAFSFEGRRWNMGDRWFCDKKKNSLPSSATCSATWRGTAGGQRKGRTSMGMGMGVGCLGPLWIAIPPLGA